MPWFQGPLDRRDFSGKVKKDGALRCNAKRVAFGGLRSEGKLVVDHTANFYWLTRKQGGRELGFQSGLDRCVTQHRWSTGSLRGNDFPGFVNQNFNRDGATHSGTPCGIWIGRLRQAKRTPV